MSSRKITHQENNEFQILRQSEANSDVTQRQLSKKLRVLPGSVFYVLNSLIARGWVNLRIFQNTFNKLEYTYLLTPEGATQKAPTVCIWVKNIKNISF